jgi:predicted acylesterase/phospholipase RssA
MYAWALPGGGANGAYQAGVCAALAANGIVPDLVVGTSVGALNGLQIAHFSKNQGGMIDHALQGLWYGIQGDKEIYKKWYFGLIPAPVPFAVGWKPSVYNSAPLHDKVRKSANLESVRSSGIKFTVVAVEWTNRATVKTWDQDSEYIVDAVLASSSYPMMFLPVEIDGIWYTDGGARDISPLKVAIDLGASKIDVIGNSPVEMGKIDHLPKGFDQVKRFADIVLDEVDHNDYREAEHINALVRCGCEGINPKWRLLDLASIPPERSLGDSLDFSPAKNRNLFDYGRARGQIVADLRRT